MKNIIIALTVCFIGTSLAICDEIEIDPSWSIGGIACESYLDGKFYESISKVTIDMNARVIEQISFNVTRTANSLRISPQINRFFIKSIDKLNRSGKIIFKGKNDFDYDFIASLSTSNNKIDFNIVAEGHGRVEVKNIGEKGLLLKRKYLQHLDLGHVN